MESDRILLHFQKGWFVFWIFSFGFTASSLLRFILASYVCLRMMQLYTMVFYLENVSTLQQSCSEQGVHTSYN
jgi:hypothetical protein